MSSTFLGFPTVAATDTEHLRGEPFPVAEVDDWQELRAAGRALKAATLARLDEHLEQLEAAVTASGGTVHWARDAAEAYAVVTDLVRTTGVDEVVKVKSMATQEIGLNEALEAAGIAALETDLAELIVQLGNDQPSHILVPAIHRNRAEIREIFRREMPGVDPALTDDPRGLAMAARRFLRSKFLSARVAVSGANFAVAETGTLAVVESEGNGQMCLTLPQTLITLMGIEKLVPAWQDLEVFLQLLPRSSTGERMNPYTSMWTGVTPGDGPQDVHLVLLDNGRTATLADVVGREALHCIRCSACLNVCPVYERVGGPRVRLDLPRPDRRRALPAADRDRAERHAAVRVEHHEPVHEPWFLPRRLANDLESEGAERGRPESSRLNARVLEARRAARSQLIRRGPVEGEQQHLVCLCDVLPDRPAGLRDHRRRLPGSSSRHKLHSIVEADHGASLLIGERRLLNPVEEVALISQLGRNQRLVLVADLGTNRLGEVRRFNGFPLVSSRPRDKRPALNGAKWEGSDKSSALRLPLGDELLGQPATLVPSIAGLGYEG